MPAQARKACKNERLSLRVSSIEKTTLESASQSVSMTTSEFVIRQAMASGEEILADRTRFLLSADLGGVGADSPRETELAPTDAQSAGWGFKSLRRLLGLQEMPV